MKVCFLTNNYSFTGGLERVLSLVANELSKRIDVDVISIYDLEKNNNYYYNQNINMNILFPNKDKKYLQQFIPTIRKIKKMIKLNRYDFLICVGIFLSPHAYFSCKGTKTKYLCWSHTPALNYEEAKIQHFLEFFSTRTANHTIVLTEENSSKLKKEYNVSNVTSIPNPIDEKLFNDINYKYNSNKIISVGRICNQKNYYKLLEVASLIMPKLKEWKWDIYGDGDYEYKNLLFAEVKKKNLDTFLSFKGNVKDIYDRYDDYSMQVLTSKYECFPMTLLEGIAKGLPIVSFDIDTGPNEIIVDEKNGYLIKPFNAKEMAEKIISLANDESKRKEMSSFNNTHRNKYRIDNIINLWIALFNSI